MAQRMRPWLVNSASSRAPQVSCRHLRQVLLLQLLQGKGNNPRQQVMLQAWVPWQKPLPLMQEQQQQWRLLKHQQHLRLLMLVTRLHLQMQQQWNLMLLQQQHAQVHSLLLLLRWWLQVVLMLLLLPTRLQMTWVSGPLPGFWPG